MQLSKLRVKIEVVFDSMGRRDERRWMDGWMDGWRNLVDCVPLRR